MRRYVATILPLLCSCTGCADVVTTPVSATYADGYAAPGESARIVLHTRRSLSGQINRVTVAGGDLLPSGIVLLDENAPGYGQYLSTPTSLGLTDILKQLFVGDPSHPQATVEVPIPPDATARGKTSLQLRVEYVRAQSSGIGEFETEAPDIVLPVPVTIVSPGWEWLIRLRDAAGRFLAGVALLAIVVGLSSLKFGASQGISEFIKFVVFVAALYGLLRFISDPLAGVFGIVQTGYRALVFIGVIIALVLFCDRIDVLYKRLRRLPHPAPPAQEAPR